MHDIVRGQKTIDEVRAYYAKEFLDHRPKQPTPYMERLHFDAADDTADTDVRVLSDEELESAVDEGKKKAAAAA